ncbi:MAG TPA: polyphenol oxidase family protein [Myxococcota bacterium]|nr:polyphenol oxidase family protein [Myxococcota bacterium]
MSAAQPLRHALLSELGVEHGFGVRGFAEPPGLLRPRQVHGIAVVDAREIAGCVPPPEADAVLSDAPGVRIGVVSADCVPILLAELGGGLVAAVHAGWRGLASGVVGACVAALHARAQDSTLRVHAEGAPTPANAASVRPLPCAPSSPRFAAVIGPHIGACCYEVDAPVLEAFQGRFARGLPGALKPSRPGHAKLALGALAREALLGAGLAAERIALLEGVCTACDRERFYSYRRDGPGTGRLVHFIAAGPRGAEA